MDLQSRWKEVMDEVILFDAGCGGDDYIVVVVVVVVVKNWSVVRFNVRLN